jgi:hypothetical protein
VLRLILASSARKVESLELDVISIANQFECMLCQRTVAEESLV